MTNSALHGPARAAASGRARRLVVLLHGLGADGDDLIDLAPIFAEILPDADFLSPHAPFACDMAPFGRQWFSLLDTQPQKIFDGLEIARPILDRFLEESLAERGLRDQDLALIGFSQGAMLALHCALRRSRPIGAIVGFSGMLVAPERLADAIAARPPILLVHGEDDPVVPFASLDLARRALEILSVPVRAVARPALAHGIDDEGIRQAMDFLAAQFAARK